MASTAALSPTTLVFPPAKCDTVERAGEALTGNAPTSPAATLASPTPTKSRLMSDSTPRSSDDVLEVAAVWLRMTITKVIAVVHTAPHSFDESQCNRHLGSCALTAPSSATPCWASDRVTTRIVAMRMAHRAHGIRALICSP